MSPRRLSTLAVCLALLALAAGVPSVSAQKSRTECISDCNRTYNEEIEMCKGLAQRCATMTEDRRTDCFGRCPGSPAPAPAPSAPPPLGAKNEYGLPASWDVSMLTPHPTGPHRMGPKVQACQQAELESRTRCVKTALAARGLPMCQQLYESGMMRCVEKGMKEENAAAGRPAAPPVPEGLTVCQFGCHDNSRRCMQQSCGSNRPGCGVKCDADRNICLRRCPPASQKETKTWESQPNGGMREVTRQNHMMPAEDIPPWMQGVSCPISFLEVENDPSLTAQQEAYCREQRAKHLASKAKQQDKQTPPTTAEPPKGGAKDAKAAKDDKKDAKDDKKSKASSPAPPQKADSKQAKTGAQKGGAKDGKHSGGQKAGGAKGGKSGDKKDGAKQDKKNGGKKAGGAKDGKQAGGKKDGAKQGKQKGGKKGDAKQGQTGGKQNKGGKKGGKSNGQSQKSGKSSGKAAGSQQGKKDGKSSGKAAGSKQGKQTGGKKAGESKKDGKSSGKAAAGSQKGKKADDGKSQPKAGKSSGKAGESSAPSTPKKADSAKDKRTKGPGSAYRRGQKAQHQDKNGRHHAKNGKFQNETATNKDGRKFDRRTGQLLDGKASKKNDGSKKKAAGQSKKGGKGEAQQKAGKSSGKSAAPAPAPRTPTKSGSAPSTPGKRTDGPSSAYRRGQKGQAKDAGNRHHAKNGKFQVERARNAKGQWFDRRTGKLLPCKTTFSKEGVCQDKKETGKQGKSSGSKKSF